MSPTSIATIDAPAVSRIRPLGHNLLVKPDTCPEFTESGLVIPEIYRDTPPMSGIVERLGGGPERDTRIRARAIARCLSILDEAAIDYPPSAALAVAKEEIGRYLREVSDAYHVCQVGDRVLFPMEVGHTLILNEDVDGARVMVSEDSLLAIYEQVR